jgi:DNA (cytosine-5)-methyltransferase 1
MSKEQNAHSGSVQPALQQANCYGHVPLKHASLFSGIGGFDLAAEWMGWENVFQCEKDEWCRKVLAKNFPATKRYADIKEFNAKEYYGAVDIISGGFPCQPFSVAGKQKGKDDDRYLWEEMLRVVGEVAPPFVVGENVTGIIGLALDTVLSDLEAQNYTTETFIIPACGKNAWHRRDRIWIVAYTNSIRRHYEQKENGQPIHNGIGYGEAKKQGGGQQQCRTGESGNILSNANDTGCEERQQQVANGEKFFAPQCSSWWEAEPRVGRVVDGLPGRVDRLKGLGNAIVPQVALEIFKVLESVHWHCP